MAQLHNIVRNGNVTSQQLGSAESANAPVSSGITTGLETFTLEYKVNYYLT
jgi:gamma-tubulin complex component 2